MNLTALVKLGVVTGIVMNVLDFVVQGVLLADMYAAAPAFRNTNDVIPYLILGDFARVATRLAGSFVDATLLPL